MFKFLKKIKEINHNLNSLIKKVESIDKKSDYISCHFDELYKNFNSIDSSFNKNISNITEKVNFLEIILMNGEIFLLRELLYYCNSPLNANDAIRYCFDEIFFFNKEKEKLQLAGRPIGYPILPGTLCYMAGHVNYFFESLCSKLDLDREKAISFINNDIYFSCGLEYVRLGLLVKTFRFWTTKEKKEYIEENLRLLNILQKKYPLSFFSFGTALGAFRDGTLIPHDFDIDISVIMPNEITTDVFRANEDVADYLTENGYQPKIDPGGGNMHLIGPNNTFFDIWVGVQNGDWVNWNPGPRDEVRLDMIAPIRNDVKLEGIQIPLPSKCEDYLRIMYGDDWQVPLKAWKRLDSYVFETKT